MLGNATFNVFATDFAMLSAGRVLIPEGPMDHGWDGRETESIIVLMSKLRPRTLVRRAPAKWPDYRPPDPAVWAERQVTTGRVQAVCRFWSILLASSGAGLVRSNDWPRRLISSKRAITHYLSQLSQQSQLGVGRRRPGSLVYYCTFKISVFLAGWHWPVAWALG